MIAWWPSMSRDTLEAVAWLAVASICLIDSSTCMQSSLRYHDIARMTLQYDTAHLHLRC